MTLSEFRNIPIVEWFFRLIPDSIYLRLLYKKNIGHWPNLSNPRSFTEKLQWLKLHNRKPEYSIMVDKYLAKDYVASVIGQEYIIPTLAAWRSVEEIDISVLPNQFVLKWNHDSGSVVICRDKSKFNLDEAKTELAKGQKKNGFWYGREWPYKNVTPVIIAEQYLYDAKSDLRDYKFFCFNGKVEYFKIDFDRFTNHKANYYDRFGKIQLFGEKVCPPDYNRKLSIPPNLSEMEFLSEKLAEVAPFVRVDFYNVNSRIFFGEITFFPASGFGLFTDNEWDDRLGELITIN